MRGNPVVRLVLIALFLGGAGLLVARIAGPANALPASASSATDASTDASTGPDEAGVPAYVELVLSAPATRVRLFDDRGGPAAFDLVPDGLAADGEIALPVRDGVLRADRLQVEWADTAKTNFLHLTLEPEGLETREATLHFPPGQRDARLELSWHPATD